MSSRARWLTLLAALLGWMFDGMEMGLFPLVGKDALKELLGGKPEQADLDLWYGVVMACFLIGAATGGVVFGWLGDKIGRVKAMTASVLLYSICSGLSAASGEAWHLAVLRFLGALGMGGEWALGVALVMEVWQGHSRVWLAGWIGAFGNLGYVICGSIAYALTQVGGQLPGMLESIGIPANLAASLTAFNNWRLLMLIGAGPALLTLLIRFFVPESEKWQQEKNRGAASFWSTKDLLGVLIGATAAGGVVALWALKDIPNVVRIIGSLLGLLLVVCGYLYPAWGYLGRSGLPIAEQNRMLKRMLLAAGLSGVPLLGTWAGLMWVYQWVGKLPSGNIPEARPILQITTALGAALGCVVGALLAGRFGRRAIYALLCVLSMITMYSFYRFNTDYGVVFVATAGLLGTISAAFYGWLPLYLPELFRTSVRATGQGFGFNFGRIIAAAGNLQMANLLVYFNNDYSQACAIVAAVYIVGIILIAIAPETSNEQLPE